MSASSAVLLLHSFGSAGRSWAAVQAELDIESRAPDLPGFAGAPALAAPSVAAYAEWVLARIDDMGGAVVLVGASMGGKIAIAAAARRPAAVRALILCAPSPPVPEPIEDDERARQLAAWGDREEAERSVRQSTETPPTSPAFACAVEDWLGTGAGAWTWWWGEGSRETIDVAGVAPSALILAGEADDHLGPAVQRRLTAPHLWRSKVREVPKSGHLLALDAPSPVAGAITAACGAR